MKTYDLPKKLANKAMKEADELIRKDHSNGKFDEGDPNNPIYNEGWNYATGQFVSLFGYKQDEFLAKQY